MFITPRVLLALISSLITPRSPLVQRRSAPPRSHHSSLSAPFLTPRSLFSFITLLSPRSAISPHSSIRVPLPPILVPRSPRSLSSLRAHHSSFLPRFPLSPLITSRSARSSFRFPALRAFSTFPMIPDSRYSSARSPYPRSTLYFPALSLILVLITPRSFHSSSAPHFSFRALSSSLLVPRAPRVPRDPHSSRSASFTRSPRSALSRFSFSPNLLVLRAFPVLLVAFSSLPSHSPIRSLPTLITLRFPRSSLLVSRSHHFPFRSPRSSLITPLPVFPVLIIPRSPHSSRYVRSLPAIRVQRRSPLTLHSSFSVLPLSSFTSHSPLAPLSAFSMFLVFPAFRFLLVHSLRAPPLLFPRSPLPDPRSSLRDPHSLLTLPPLPSAILSPRSLHSSPAIIPPRAPLSAPFPSAIRALITPHSSLLFPSSPLSDVPLFLFTHHSSPAITDTRSAFPHSLLTPRSFHSISAHHSSFPRFSFSALTVLSALITPRSLPRFVFTLPAFSLIIVLIAPRSAFPALTLSAFRFPRSHSLRDPRSHHSSFSAPRSALSPHSVFRAFRFSFLIPRTSHSSLHFPAFPVL